MRILFGLLGLTSMAYSGGYLGVHSGLVNYQYNAQFTKDLNAVTGRPTDYFLSNHGVNSFVGGIHAGWMFKSGSLAVGPEISGDYSSLNKKIFSISYVQNIRETLSVRHRGALDLSVRFGISSPDKGFFYIKPTLGLGKFDIRYKAYDGNTTAGVLYQDHKKTSKSDTSFKIGLGYEGYFTEKLALRGELSHAFAQDQRIYIPKYVPQDYQLEETTIKFRRSATSFVLGLSYYL